MSSIVNYHATNLLKYSLLGVGIYYGMARNASLTSLVHHRHELGEKKLEDDFIQEGKIVYEAHVMNKLAKEAKKAHIEAIDPNSFKYNAEVAVNWLLAKMESEPAKK